MPFEWLSILAHPIITEKTSTLLKLKYEMTVDDVYDLLEYLSYEDWKEDERRIAEEAQNKK